MQSRMDKPFFAYIATNAPHSPLMTCLKICLNEYLNMDLSNDRFPQDLGHPLSGNTDLEVLARIYAMITNIDDNVGRLFSRLDDLNLTEETIVIFLTDNGPNSLRYTAGMKGNKTTVYEGGIRTPLLVRWPGELAPGISSDLPAAHIDIMPTVLDALDIDPPSDLLIDGRSFLPLLTGDQNIKWPDRYLTIQSHRGDVPYRYHNFMIRNNRWKLLQASGFGAENFSGEPRFELYDLLADPFEMSNVSGSNPDVVNNLKNAYDAWFDDVGSTRPDNYGKLRIHINPQHEPTTVLTRQDWHPIKPINWEHPEADGYWELYVDEPNRYNINVMFPASFTDGLVTLVLNDSSYESKTVSSKNTQIFESVQLAEGPVRLSAKLEDGEIIRGAWQVEISKHK